MADVSVIIEDIPYDDTGAPFLASLDTAIMDEKLVTRYERDLHRYMMGITSPAGFGGGSAAFVQLAAPTLLWVVDWYFSAFGKQPKAPSFVSVDSNWVPLLDLYEPMEMRASADGSIIYRISGTYVYGHKNPPADLSTLLSYPKPPWLDTDSAGIDRSMSSDRFIGGLSSNAQGNIKSNPGSSVTGP